jgi:acetate CoA/acetoacetate CoA-transferase alpha subunit
MQVNGLNPKAQQQMLSKQISVDLSPQGTFVSASARDFALVHAFLADYLGNLAYALTARNFNPVMTMATDTVIVTAENIVPVGVTAPDHVITPGPLVDFLVLNGEQPWMHALPCLAVCRSMRRATSPTG